MAANVMRRRLLAMAGAVVALSGVGFWAWRRAPALSDAQVSEVYRDPPAAPQGNFNVFHLGHSLVGHDMPAMLAQLAGQEHSHASQLGWGTSLREHWEPKLTINGFDQMNDHPRFEPAREALQGGDFDALVLTEMVEIRDAIKYHDSAKYLHKWAEAARSARPDIRIYLYETWHRLDDPDGWLARIDRDLAAHWEGEILLPTLAALGGRVPIYVIPAGQVMGAVVRAIKAQGGVDNLQSRADLFAVDPEGKPDQIHFSDLGAYLVALTHYATLYQRSPVGLPYELKRADGQPAMAPGAAAAQLMQQIVWKVVTALPRTGVTA